MTHHHRHQRHILCECRWRVRITYCIDRLGHIAAALVVPFIHHTYNTNRTHFDAVIQSGGSVKHSECKKAMWGKMLDVDYFQQRWVQVESRVAVASRDDDKARLKPALARGQSWARFSKFLPTIYVHPAHLLGTSHSEHGLKMAQPASVLQFSGHQYLRHRLVLSILSGKPVRIDKIRPDDKNPGLRGAQYLYI